MISDKDIAQLVLGLYAYPDSPSVTWDWLDDGSADDQICWAIKDVDGTDVIVLRGSTTFTDWARDFNAWADPFNKTAIGHVHPGFLLGMEQMKSEALEKMTAKNFIITGHSLGAARADILTGLMLRDGHDPLRRVVFGEPKPGFSDFAQLISIVPSQSYCCGDDYGHDLVTDVPFSFPPENYVHPTPMTSVHNSPAINDRWGPFRYHHMQLYAAAIPGG